MRSEKDNKQKSRPRDAQKPGVDKEHGEGNYKASRQYNDATREFVESGQVAEAAKKAKPATRQEQEEMRQAEQAGLDKSKGEDPKLYKDGGKTTDIH